jgi:predicted membrane channel-forming protein YqfA (hemolysin III family)
MENSLKVIINFNEKITRRQLEKYFYYSWKQKLPSILRNFVFAIIFLLIVDCIFKVDRSRVDLKFLGYFVIAYFLMYVVIFYYNKINYNSKINQHIDESKKPDSTVELLLDEQSFYIKCEQYDIRSIWKKVSYSISGNTLLISISIGTTFTFLLNEEETDQYQNVLAFLKVKCKLKNN